GGGYTSRCPAAPALSASRKAAGWRRPPPGPAASSCRTRLSRLSSPHTPGRGRSPKAPRRGRLWPRGWRPSYPQDMQVCPLLFPSDDLPVDGVKHAVYVPERGEGGAELRLRAAVTGLDCRLVGALAVGPGWALRPGLALCAGVALRPLRAGIARLALGALRSV